jgi:hypothetical protein
MKEIPAREIEIEQTIDGPVKESMPRERGRWGQPLQIVRTFGVRIRKAVRQS